MSSCLLALLCRSLSFRIGRFCSSGLGLVGLGLGLVGLGLGLVGLGLGLGLGLVGLLRAVSSGRCS